MRRALRAALVASSGNSSTAEYVEFTTTGATFNPVLELVSGSEATVSWSCEETEDTATGLTPTLSFGTSATRHVRMSATGGNGLRDIKTINLGFSASDDSGRYGPGSGYNKTAVGVSGVTGLTHCTGLVQFMAAHTDLTGTLNLTGLSALEFVECFAADIQEIVLTGCTALKRLCLEANKLTTLNLTPVAGNLYDLRAAAQQGGSLALTVSGVMTNLYHLCTRDQTVTGHPTAAQLPAVFEQWDWNTGQTGTLTVDSSAATSLLSYQNSYTDVDITGQSTLTRIDLHDCDLTQSVVDAILAEVDSWGTSSHYIDLSSNAAPSSPTHVNALLSRGWTVLAEASFYWEDLFERADATGLTNVGNGWHTNSTAATANIVSGDLVKTDTGAYRVLLNPAGGALPADYTVTATIPAASVGTYFGIVGRWDTDNGVAALVATSTTDYKIFEANGYLNAAVTVITDASAPASWTTPTAGDHTFALELSGTTATIILDGVRVAHGTISRNATATGTEVGICGEGASKHIKSLVVT